MHHNNCTRASHLWKKKKQKTKKKKQKTKNKLLFFFFFFFFFQSNCTRASHLLVHSVTALETTWNFLIDDLWRTTNHKTIKWVRFLAIQPQQNYFNYSEIFLAIASMVVATTPNYWMENKIDSSCQTHGKTDSKNLQRVLQHCCKIVE